ncbi:MAG TPA: ATP synthase subunit I [Terriglobales bacterium]|nr:ATP synthase subunit I [Terriglobales bacterium]
MSTSPTHPPESPVIETQSNRFFSGAIRRMLRFVLIVGLAFTLAALWRFGLLIGLGFGAGASTAYLSFHSLSRAVETLAKRVAETNRPTQGPLLVARFTLRYLLAGMVAYVIFTSSSQAFRGFLFGLCTPVAAMMMEAGCEAYVALRRGY